MTEGEYNVAIQFGDVQGLIGNPTKLVRCTECSWVGPIDRAFFGHNDLVCPRCYKEAVDNLHSATLASPALSLELVGCYGGLIWVEQIKQIIAIKDGKVKAWLDGGR